MRTAIYRLIAFAIALGSSALAWPHDLAGQWDLKIEDMKHHVVTVLVIEFTEKQARSCIGGNWLRVNVVSATTEDSHFFPVSDSLSYGFENGKLIGLEDGQLIIGRNEVCDAYLWLRGALRDETAHGDYFGFGWGHRPLGFFVLSKRKSSP